MARPATFPAFRGSASRRSGRPTPASASRPRAARTNKRERTALPSGHRDRGDLESRHRVSRAAR